MGRGARPRVRPIDGTFVDGVLYVGGSPETAWVRDLSANGAVSVNLDGADRMDVVIVEGDAEWLEPPIERGLAEQLAAATNAKYPQYGVQTADTYRAQGTWAIRPIRAVAWTDFAKNPTRFRFPSR